MTKSQKRNNRITGGILAELARWTALLILTGATAACAGNPAAARTTVANSPPAATLPIPTIAAPTGAPVVTFSPEPSVAPTGAALNFNRPPVVTLAGNLPGPDDLLLAPDGSIYLSDVSDGTVKRFVEEGGAPETVVAGLAEPEGMVLLPDGSLVIAEQGKNRLVRFDPRTKTIAPFLVLANPTGRLGVDGIALDEHTPGEAAIIVPDSPNGTVLRVSLDGKQVTEVARGLSRPTSAWVEQDGSILVTEEDGGALSRIHPGGGVEKLASYTLPDDVVEDGAGNIYVAALGDGAVHVIPAGSGPDRVLAKGLSGPQGLILDARGNPVATDPGNHRVLEIRAR